MLGSGSIIMLHELKAEGKGFVQLQERQDIREIQ